jgi:hypothetical protein
MKSRSAVFMMLAATLPVLAQTTTPSLAERARQIREEKEKSGEPKATQVITNDEMKPAAPTVETKEKAKVPTASLAAIEKKYRQQSSQLHSQLKQAEAHAQELKDDMAKASPASVTVVHYYYNPKYLKQLQAAIDQNNTLIASLQKRIAALKEEVHSKGYPDSWADPE